MAEHAATTVTGPRAAPAKLEPNVVSITQDTVIGLASVAPTVSVTLTLAGLAVAAAYAGGVTLVILGIPMLIIANAYRRLNMWQANCGASFEWVGRAINPWLGFMTGWLMITAYITGGVSGGEVIGPSVLAVFGSGAAGGVWADIAIGTAVIAVMLVIAIIGIRITARTQVGIAVVEYTILVGIAVAALVATLTHTSGTIPISRDWFTLGGVGGHGSFVGAAVAAVFMYSGWEGGVYVNEESKRRHINPGRAALIVVGFLIILYTFAQIALQAAVSPKQLQAHADAPLVYIATTLGHSVWWGRLAALALALSVVALQGTTIVLGARIIYGMASHRTLPSFLANISHRYSTPVAASVLVGVLAIAITIIYLLATSVQNAFNLVVNLSGQLFAGFYILTGLALVVYYRRLILSSFWNFVILGVLPLGASAFLAWILVEYLKTTDTDQQLAMGGTLLLGVVLAFVARYGLKSPFFKIRREAWAPEGEVPGRHAAS